MNDFCNLTFQTEIFKVKNFKILIRKPENLKKTGNFFYGSHANDPEGGRNRFNHH